MDGLTFLDFLPRFTAFLPDAVAAIVVLLCSFSRIKSCASQDGMLTTPVVSDDHPADSWVQADLLLPYRMLVEW